MVLSVYLLPLLKNDMTVIFSLVLGFNPQKLFSGILVSQLNLSKTLLCLFWGNDNHFLYTFYMNTFLVNEEPPIFLSSRLCPFLINMILFLI